MFDSVHRSFLDCEEDKDFANVVFEMPDDHLTTTHNFPESKQASASCVFSVLQTDNEIAHNITDISISCATNDTFSCESRWNLLYETKPLFRENASHDSCPWNNFRNPTPLYSRHPFAPLQPSDYEGITQHMSPNIFDTLKTENVCLNDSTHNESSSSENVSSENMSIENSVSFSTSCGYDFDVFNLNSSVSRFPSGSLQNWSNQLINSFKSSNDIDNTPQQINNTNIHNNIYGNNTTTTTNNNTNSNNQSCSNNSGSIRPNNNKNNRSSKMSSRPPHLKSKRIRQHIPHALRSKEFVQKRNSRERKRIGSVNDAFNVLRQYIPILKHDEKASKINILRFATRYIRDLTMLSLK